VVLLHGYTSCCDASWFADGMAKELARTHRVIGIDARGHGRSEKPYDPAKYDGDRMPRDVIEVLDELGVQKAHFHGYSMGGGIVAHLIGAPSGPLHHGELRRLRRARDRRGPGREGRGVRPARARSASGRGPRQAGRPRRPRQRSAEGGAGWPSGQTLDRTRTGPDKHRFSSPGGDGEFDAPISKTQRLEREVKDFRAVDPARPRPQHRDHGRFHAQALYRHGGGVRPGERPGLAGGPECGRSRRPSNT